MLTDGKVTLKDGTVIYGYEKDYIFEILKDTGDYYENALLEQWTPLLKDVQVIFDVGANIGNHSVYWAKHLNAKRIFSFEPFAANYSILRKNIAENGLSEIIVPCNQAVGNQVGFSVPSNVDEIRLGETAFIAATGSGEGAVESVTIDTFTENEKPGALDFIKIDTEGAEIDILKGATRTLDKFKPLLWVEVRLDTYKQIIEMLDERGYKLVSYNRFNYLFAFESADAGEKDYTENKIFDDMMYYLSRMDMYAGRYAKTQKWLDEKQESLRIAETQNLKLKRNIAELEEKKNRLLAESEQLLAEKRALFAKIKDINANRMVLQTMLQTAKDGMLISRERHRRRMLENSDGELNSKVYGIVDERTAEDCRGIFQLETPPNELSEWRVRPIFVSLAMENVSEWVEKLEFAWNCGMPIIGILHGDKSKLLLVKFYGHLLDVLIVTDPEVYAESVARQLLPFEKIILQPAVVDIKQYNPLTSRQDYQKFAFSGWKDTNKYNLWAEALDGAFGAEADEGTAGQVAYIPAPGNGLDTALLALVAQNKNLLLPVSTAAQAYFGSSLFVNGNAPTSIAYLQVLRARPVYAAALRASALRTVLSQFCIKHLTDRIKTAIFAKKGERITVCCVARCHTHQQADYLLEQFNRQSYPRKSLMLITELPPWKSDEAVFFVEPGKLADVAVQADYVAMLDKGNLYGSEYLNDLVLSLQYANTSCVVKSGGFVVEEGKVNYRQTDEYVELAEFYPARGICPSGLASEDWTAFCTAQPFAWSTLAIDSFEFVLDGHGLDGTQAEASMSTTNAQVSLKELERVAKEQPTSLASRRREEKIILGPELFNCEENTPYFTVSEDETHANIQTQGHMTPHYLNPKGYPVGASYAKSPPLNFCDALKPGKQYTVTLDLTKEGRINIFVLLVFYDESKQLKQIRIDPDPTGRTRIQVPEETRYVLPLLRFSGTGNACFSGIRILSVDGELANMDDFGQPTINGILQYDCDEQEEHRYLVPQNLEMDRFSEPPRVSYYYPLQAGISYTFTCDWTASGAAECIPVLVLYDDEKQLMQVRMRRGYQRTFLMPQGVKYAVPMLRVAGKGTIFVDNMSMRLNQDALQPEHPTTNEYLLVTNLYPSENDPYANMFVHVRAKAYLRAGLPVQVYVARRQPPGQVTTYFYEGVRVTVGNQTDLTERINQMFPKKILIHFVSPLIMQGIWASNHNDVPLLVWCHGADVYPPYRRLFNARNYRRSAAYCQENLTRVRDVQKLAQDPRVCFVPVSQALKEDIQDGYDLTDGADIQVIHNYIDTTCFQYVPKPPQQRLRIISVKSYKTYMYATDVLVQVIQILVERAVFDKLEFDLYGNGDLFFPSMLGVAGYPNVHFHRKFLHQKELARLYQSHGVVLVPTRHDTHGVSRDEAMACGVVPVTNNVAAVGEFVDESCGFLLGPEDIHGMADAIEQLANDPQLFCEMSKNAANKVRNTVSYERTLQKEIDLITSETGQGDDHV